MELIGIVVLAVILYGIWMAVKWIWTHFIIPVWIEIIVPGAKLAWSASTIAGAVLIIGGLSVGAVISIYHYIVAAREYANPFACPKKAKSRKAKNVYQDKSKKKEEYVQHRSYFFGPGYYSLVMTFQTAFAYNLPIIDDLQQWIRNFRTRGGAFRTFLSIFLYIFWLGFTLSVLVVGSATTVLCTAIHAVVMLVVMSVAYCVFTVLWLMDRMYLWSHSIRALCPVCKHRAVVPTFRCPACGNPHRRLVPSAYGILHHRCTCGQKLPTTFFNGRSRLSAQCPYCGDSVASSDAAQFGLTMVGGSASGKTVLLSAFYHLFTEQVRQKTGLLLEIPSICQLDMENLEEVFCGRTELAGTELGIATRTYSVLLSGEKLKSRVQFSLFDVAGEAFGSSDLKGMSFTEDMGFSNGIIVVVDPLSSRPMQREAWRNGVNLSIISDMNAAAVVNNFAAHLHTLHKSTRVGERITRPTAVIISKLDIACVFRKLSHQSIQREIRMHPEMTPIAVQDMVSRRFLDENGFSDLLAALDANFTNVHFFPISATGGVDRGEAFEPDSYVLQPFEWLIRRSHPTLADTLNIPDEEGILKGFYAQKQNSL